VKRFDKQAETAAERRRGREDGPPPAVNRAVQRALATGHRTFEDDLSSLDVLLHLDNNPDSPPEQGPPQPGSHAYEVVIELFGRVARDIRKVRDAVSAVDFDPEDKQKLRAALGEAAAAWDLRAKAFASTDPPTTSATLSAAWAHEARAASYKKALGQYFPESES
jgi:hypothetical protein